MKIGNFSEIMRKVVKYNGMINDFDYFVAKNGEILIVAATETKTFSFTFNQKFSLFQNVYTSLTRRQKYSFGNCYCHV